MFTVDVKQQYNNTTLTDAVISERTNSKKRDWVRCGRYKVRKEPSPAKRCEKSGKDAKRAVLWKKNRLCYIELDLIALALLKINVSELQIF